ncbi:hypothetical protein J2046_003059 [Rhizobium petrolearium]|nr:hypothetical protein [Neorhizobium petrolearium]MBP1844792.1 hypothetical protein [Neorhizobium petrolearium]
MKNPFIPSHSPICRVADLIMIFGIAVAGLVAAIAAVFVQVSA